MINFVFGKYFVNLIKESKKNLNKKAMPVFYSFFLCLNNWVYYYEFFRNILCWIRKRERKKCFRFFGGLLLLLYIYFFCATKLRLIFQIKFNNPVTKIFAFPFLTLSKLFVVLYCILSNPSKSRQNRMSFIHSVYTILNVCFLAKLFEL